MSRSLEITLRRAAVRILTERLLCTAGRGLSGGLLVALGLTAADRLLNLELPLSVLLGPLVLGGLVGAGLTLRRRPRATEIAIELDHRSGLRDRLGTAASLPTNPNAHPGFASLVRRDAERAAADLDLNRTVPIKWDRSWFAVLGGGTALAAALLWWTPSTGSNELADAPPAVEAAASTSAEIRDLVATVRQDAPEVASDLEDPLAALDDLAEQLEQSGPDADTARDAAGRLAEAADALDRQAKELEAEQRALTERFRGLDGQEDDPTNVRDALRDGDFARAAEQLDRLLDEQNAMTDAERAEAADALRDLARDLEQLDDPPSTESDALRKDLADRGLDEETIDEWLNDPPPAESMAERLEEEGTDATRAHDLARDLEQQETERNAQDQSRETTDDLAETLKENADQLEDNEPPVAPPEEGDSSRDSDDSPADDDASAGDEPPREPEATSGDSPEESGGNDADSAAGDEDGTPETGSPGESSPSTETSREAGQESEAEAGDRETEGRQREQSNEAGSEPGDAETKPADTGTEPGDAETKPADTGAEPGDAETKPADTGTEPGDAETKPADTGTEPGDAETKPADAGAEPGDSETKPADAGTEPGDASRQPAPSDADGGAEGATPEGAGEQATEPRGAGDDEPRDPSARRRTSDQLRDLKRRYDTTDSHRNRSREARDLARRLTQGTPAESESPDAGRGSAASETPPGTDPWQRPEGAADAPRFDPVDLGGDDLNGPAMTDWLNPGSPAAEGLPRSPPLNRNGVSRARRNAEQAIEENAVPARYHDFIRRYFRNLERAVSEPAPAPAPPDSGS